MSNEVKPEDYQAPFFFNKKDASFIRNALFCMYEDYVGPSYETMQRLVRYIDTVSETFGRESTWESDRKPS